MSASGPSIKYVTLYVTLFDPLPMSHICNKSFTPKHVTNLWPPSHHPPAPSPPPPVRWFQATSVAMLKMNVHCNVNNPRTASCFCYVNGGEKLHPAVSPERIGIFRCGLHQSVGNHEHIISDVLETKNFQATPTKIKMAAIRQDVNWMSWFERDITKLPTATSICWGPATVHDGNSVDTLRRRSGWKIKDGRH